MKKREMRQLLLQAGFVFIRHGTRHELWKKGDKTVALSNSHHISPRTLKSFKSLIRKEKSREDV